MSRGTILTVGVFAVAALASLLALAADQPAPSMPQPPAVDVNGTLQVPSFSLPYSALASPEAKGALIEQLHTPLPIAVMGNAGIAAIRKAMDDKFFGPLIDKQNARYPVTMTTDTIGGVYTQIFTPKLGIAPKNKNRVLINLHGGGFT